MQPHFALSGGSIVVTTEPGDPGDFTSTGTLTFMLNNGALLTGTLSNITLDQHGKMAVLTGTLNRQQVSNIIASIRHASFEIEGAAQH